MAKSKRWMNRKAKGTNAERELIHIFHSYEWSAVRIAGSGSTRYPAPDVLAGNGFRRIAIEAKLITATRKYFSYEDIEQLQAFSQTFGCESWLAVKFPNKVWFFFNPEDLIETKTAFVATTDLADRCGLTVEELLEVVSIQPPNSGLNINAGALESQESKQLCSSEIVENNLPSGQ